MLRFFPGPNGLLYHYMLLPAGARTCVIICSSILGAFESNYHRERLLARALARRGHAVIRFHYAGEGNSFGERAELTFQSMYADAAAVLSGAEMHCFGRYAFVGTQIGAYVAAHLASLRPSALLALWEPDEDPSRMVRDALRKKRMSDVAQGREIAPTAAGRETFLGEDGILDLLGYDVYPPLLESLTGLDLAAVLGPTPRSLFIAWFAGARRGVHPLVTQLQSRRHDVEEGDFNVSESWWFQSDAEPDTGDLITTTTVWLDEQLGGGV